MRFLRAYLASATVATVTLLLVHSVEAVIYGALGDFLTELPDTALFYAIYGFSFTLVLGLTGWSLLQLIDAHSARAYAVVGGVFGLVTAMFWTGLSMENPFLYSFTGAGATAALAFRWAYYRSVSSTTAAA